MTHSKALLGTAALAVSAALPLAAHAGCKPKCTGDQICRYEAAGGTYYCAAPKSASIKGDLGRPLMMQGATDGGLGSERSGK